MPYIVRLILVNNREPTGIGTFTVLDAGNVSPEDAGNNFFLTQKSIGTSRAEEVTKLLGELNENVKGIADTRVRLASFEFPSFVSLLLGYRFARPTTDEPHYFTRDSIESSRKIPILYETTHL